MLVLISVRMYKHEIIKFIVYSYGSVGRNRSISGGCGGGSVCGGGGDGGGGGGGGGCSSGNSSSSSIY